MNFIQIKELRKPIFPNIRIIHSDEFSAHPIRLAFPYTLIKKD
ncbi:hypothetical protein UF75_4011 [Desulfosporosinus sp. I2]|nr:hypothetical protein UF75_4011 [Desulfosporosinus sp. I2]